MRVTLAVINSFVDSIFCAQRQYRNASTTVTTIVIVLSCLFRKHYHVHDKQINQRGPTCETFRHRKNLPQSRIFAQAFSPKNTDLLY